MGRQWVHFHHPTAEGLGFEGKIAVVPVTTSHEQNLLWPAFKGAVHVTLTITVCVRHWYNLHLKDDKPETQRGAVTQGSTAGESGAPT